MLKYENQAKKHGFSRIIGVDEAGRGPLAGPVVAAAVTLKTQKFQVKICDSKKLSALQRERAFLEIFQKAYVGIGVASEVVIDRTNILKATYHAMTISIMQLVSKLSETKSSFKDLNKHICLLIDGRSFETNLPYAYRTIIHGDSLSFSIACASIVAKVFRDRMLGIYDQIFPQYGFKRHKGYPTLAHKKAIRENGLSIIHRKTFHSGLTRKDKKNS